jgi:hypothetical protein
VTILLPEDIYTTAVLPRKRESHSFPKIFFEFPADVIGWHVVCDCGLNI